MWLALLLSLLLRSLIRTMLSRFLDKNKKNGGGVGQQGDPQQGSLLDLMQPSGLPTHTPPAAVPLPVQGSGSLLSDISSVEAQQRKRLEKDYEALKAREELLALKQELARAEAAQPVAARRSSSRSQTEQLDFLDGELRHLRSRIGGGGDGGGGGGRGRYRDEGHGASGFRDGYGDGNHRGGPPTAPPVPGRFDGFSFDNFAGALIGSWKLIVLAGLIGGMFAAFYAMTLPNMYQSVAEILIEPRGLKVVNNSVAPDGLNSEATVAYAESQVRIIYSSSVVDPVIDDLELAEDPEFNGTSGLPGFGIIGRLTGASVGDGRSAAKRYLYENLSVRRVAQTFSIEIMISTTDPAKSARIANAMARSYLVAESGSRSSIARSASADLTARLDELRQQVRDNEEQVERYKAENGLVDADGKLVSEVQLARLNEQLVLARVQTSDARTRAQQASETDLGDVLSGSLPAALNNPTVSQLRLDYSRANSRLERLSAKLGQRHPDRIAATSERRSVLNAITEEMRRIVKSAQEDFKRAQARQADLTAQMNQLRAAAVNDSAAKVKLRELNRQVDASRQVYESFLLRSRETGEQEKLRASSARIISEAVPISDKTGPNRKLLVVIGGIAGGMIGALLALVPWVLYGIRFMLAVPKASVPRPVVAGGDLYSTTPMPAAGTQMPLPGFNPRQNGGGAPAMTYAPSGHAAAPVPPPPSSASHGLYESWGDRRA